MFYKHFLISINFFMSASFLPKKERNTGFRQAMYAIKSQDEFRKKICSKGSPSFYSIMILRNFTRIKYFNAPYVSEQDSSFWRMEQWCVSLFWVKDVLITYLMDENSH